VVTNNLQSRSQGSMTEGEMPVCARQETERSDKGGKDDNKGDVSTQGTN